jgi:acyl-CoA reductase-like NAD-dependent aldehyde dehydrogenase
VVLIIAPSNFPLFLAGAQILQALVAGNAVLAKPAPGCATPLARLAERLIAAGLPPDLLTVLGEEIEAGVSAIEAGVDKVLLTGGAETGARVLAALAPHLTPAVMELSGSDPVFILPGADLGQAAAAIAAGLTLNAGRTCIGPRRLFAPRAVAPELEELIAERLTGQQPAALSEPARARVIPLIEAADAAGCRFRPSPPEVKDGAFAPVLIADARATLPQFNDDIFAPVLALIAVDDMEEALALAASCPYALGASIFGPISDARALAACVRAGAVTINDLIVPTADPRLPFGGSGKSGFGVTRGAEGLLELTKIKTLSASAARTRPYHQPPAPGDAVLFQAYVELAHGSGLRSRCRALFRLIRSAVRLGRSGAS